MSGGLCGNSTWTQLEKTYPKLGADWCGGNNQILGAPPGNAICIMPQIFGKEAYGTSKVQMGTFSRFPGRWKRMQSLEGMSVNRTF